MGAKLQALRMRAGLTQPELGDRLNLSFKTISAYENDRAVLGSDDFERWADALGISVAELTTALGFGPPPSDGSLYADLLTIYGPHRGASLEKALRLLEMLAPADQEQMIESLLDQVAGRHARQRDQ
jgi:transcriptional regulator with XRE-family HTH domain